MSLEMYRNLCDTLNKLSYVIEVDSRPLYLNMIIPAFDVFSRRCDAAEMLLFQIVEDEWEKLERGLTKSSR